MSDKSPKMTFSGPMFEGADSGPWKSVYRKEGAHYNNYGCRDSDGMAALREFFPDAQANSMNLVLFSTSGVHGTYGTIEDAAADIARGFKDEHGNNTTPSVTFLVVQPRIACLRHGNCLPRTDDDIAFLATLRQSSWAAAHEIGRAS